MTNVELMLDELELSTRRIDSRLLGLLRKEGISRTATFRIGKTAMNLEIRNAEADMVDQLVDRFGFNKRSQAVELAVRFTIRAVMRAERLDMLRRKKAEKEVLA